MKLSLAAVMSVVMGLANLTNALFTNGIEQLTERNFSTMLQEKPNSIWLVTFYVPWCEHAAALSPELEAAAADLMSKGFQIQFGAVDVSKNQQLGWAYQIESSPTIKIFFNQDGELVATDYLGDRMQGDIHSFCQDQYRQKNILYSDLPDNYVDGHIVELDDDNFDRVVMGSNEIWLLKFAAPWCYHCNILKPTWEAAALELGSNVRFGLIDADANRGLARRFSIQKLPTLKFFNAGYGKTDDEVEDYDGGRTLIDITQFARDMKSEYDADPSKYAYVANVAIPTSLSATPPVVCDGTTLGSHEDCMIPEDLSQLCTPGSLCVVAFLSNDS
jgi:protein disulfide-isomerase-like protein